MTLEKEDIETLEKVEEMALLSRYYVGLLLRSQNSDMVVRLMRTLGDQLVTSGIKVLERAEVIENRQKRGSD